MDERELGYTDFIAIDAAQPSAAREGTHFPDLEAIAVAERADAEAFRLV